MKNSQASLFNEQADSIPVIDKMGQAEVEYKKASVILSRTSGFISSYDFTLNPYSGCSFGCTYCYAAFFSKDPQKVEQWGYWVTVKENALDIMRRHKIGSLDNKRIYMSSVTDPYQPLERKIRLTRGLLNILIERHTPKLVVQTRGPLVAEDIPLFNKIEAKGGRVQVNMTITTDDEDIRKAFEPLCPANSQRLQAIQRVKESGINACITITPTLLIRDIQGFIEGLLATGVHRFITQSFHWGSGQFMAGTRDEAMTLLADKLQCSDKEVIDRYNQRYQTFRRQLQTELKKRNLPPAGEGKEGFKPPF